MSVLFLEGREKVSASCGIQHCDFFGRELLIGDHVAFIDPRYHEFRHGEILKLNEKQATICGLDIIRSYHKKRSEYDEWRKGNLSEVL